MRSRCRCCGPWPASIDCASSTCLGRGSHEVHELADELGLQQAATSQHLAAMRAAGLVEAVRDGRAVRYRLSDQQISTACELMREALVRRLSRLGDLAAQASASPELVLSSREVGQS